MNTPKYCIYRITNKINGKSYIGQHKYTNETNPMDKYSGSGKLLKIAYKKYGKDNFKIEVLYERIRDKTTADAMEIWVIEKYRPEYNIAKGGNGGDTFSGQTEEWKEHRRKQMSEYLKNNNPMDNPSLRDKATKAIRAYYQSNESPLKGKPHTEEHNGKVKESLHKFYKTHKHNASYGKSKSSEMRSKLSKSRKGLKWFMNDTEVVQAYECPEGFWPGHPVWNVNQMARAEGKNKTQTKEDNTNHE